MSASDEHKTKERNRKDLHLVDIHRSRLDWNLSLPTRIGSLIMQHLRDMAHDHRGVLVLLRLHAWLDDTRHAPASVGKLRGIHDGGPVNGDQ